MVLVNAKRLQGAITVMLTGLRHAGPAFAGLLFKTTLAQSNQKPHVTAYFGDYHSVFPQYEDGVVLIQPLDRRQPPLVLESDNQLIDAITKALKSGGHFNGRNQWPWMNELKMLFDEAWGKLTHPQHGWLSQFSSDSSDPNEGFNRLFDGHRPQNKNLSLEELIGETLGFRYGRHTEQIEPTGRRPLIDNNLAGLLGDQAHRLPIPVGDLKPSVVQKTDTVGTIDRPDGDEPDTPVAKKRYTLPEPMGEWLKHPDNRAMVEWLMRSDHQNTLQWLRRSGYMKLMERIKAMTTAQTPPPETPIA